MREFRDRPSGSDRLVCMVAATAAFMAPRLASAQETITLEVRFAHPVLSSGQTQQVEIWASFAPGLGTPVPWNTPPGQGQILPVAAFGSASFDVLSLANAETGSYTNLTVNPWLNSWGMVGTPQPNGDVTEVLAWQIFSNASQNPVQLWSATWTPHTYDPRSVSLETHLRGSVYILLEAGLQNVRQEWTGIETQGSFQIIPSPGVIPVLGLAGFLAARRRRR